MNWNNDVYRLGASPTDHIHSTREVGILAQELVSTREDLSTMTNLMDKREKELTHLHSENSSLREEVARLRQDLNSTSTQNSRRESEITRLEKLLATLRQNSKHWEFLARETSNEASENFKISDSLKSDLETSSSTISDLSNFLIDLIENFSFAPSVPNFRALNLRLKSLRSEISSAPIPLLHQEFRHILDLPKLSQPPPAPIVNRPVWNSSLK